MNRLLFSRGVIGTQLSAHTRTSAQLPLLRTQLPHSLSTELSRHFAINPPDAGSRAKDAQQKSAGSEKSKTADRPFGSAPEQIIAAERDSEDPLDKLVKEGKATKKGKKIDSQHRK